MTKRRDGNGQDITRRAANAKLPDLERRRRALEKTLRKYRGKAFELGVNDCALMVRSHLVAMGHKGIPTVPRYRTPLGALQVVRTLAGGEGTTLEAVLDRLLPRIPPAAMLPGDVALVAADPDAPAASIGTVVISLGGKTAGWHPDQEEMAVIQVLQFEAAWRA